MSYVIEKRIKGKKYFYLVKNIRVGGSWKKFTVYIGKGKIGKRRLGELKKRYSKILDKKVAKFLKSTDPLFSVLSEKQVAELERIKAAYKKAQKTTSPAARARWYEWFLTSFTYNTNAIEGSTVNLAETSMVLFEKLMPRGKTAREVMEVENHKKAFDCVLAYRGDLSREFICRVHKIMTSGILRDDESGVLRKVQVYIRGSDIVPPRPKDVERGLRELILWYRRNRRRYHPVVVSAYVHTAFEGIHPFVDYNGRTGRLILNFILMKNGYPPIVIAYRKRAEYYEAVRSALRGNLKPFVQLLYTYLKGVKF